MGGVPMLLMVAALGVDYGWQPDGGGGVEYVIQVPADQWDRVKELGEISSVIDPQVQGRVSRVIIRVGSSPLPRTAPALSASSPTSNTRPASSSVVAAVDLTPVPIPEMSDGRYDVPIPGERRVTGDVLRSSSEAVMKPDPADPPGSGFSLPTMHDVTNAGRNVTDQLQRDLAANAQATVDSTLNRLRPGESSANDALSRLGNAARDAAGTMAGNAGTSRTAAPSTAPLDWRNNPLAGADPAASRTPPFTGAATGAAAATNAAGVRPGGPSTDPIGQESARWTPPSTTRVAPPDYASAPAATRNDANAGGANLAQPNAGYGASGGFAQVPDSLRRDTTAARTDAANAYADSTQASPQANAADPRGYGGANLTYPSTSATNNPAVDPRQVDPRLTARERALLPPGAYTFNTRGEPIAYDGTRLDANGYPIASPDTLGTTPYPATTAVNNSSTNYPAQNYPPSAYPGTTGQQSAYPVTGFPSTGFANGGYSDAGNASNYNPPGTTYNPAATASLGQISPMAPSLAVDPRLADTRLAAGARANDLARANESLIGRSGLSGNTNQGYSTIEDLAGSSSDQSLSRGETDFLNRTHATVLGSRPTIAAQPLFNVLLLLSIVANFYLVYWLKNMRHQFRDLVAAKRMAQSSNSVA